MKIFLILINLFFSLSVFAQTSQTENTQTIFDGIVASTNYVKNPYARLTGNIDRQSTNATCGRGTTNLYNGKASWTITTTAQGGYCEFDLAPIYPQDTSPNKRCVFFGEVIGNSSLHKAQVLIGGNTYITNEVLGNNSAWREFWVEVPCGITPTVRITQTEAGSASPFSAAVGYSRSFKSREVTQPTFYGGAQQDGGTNCQYQQSTSTALTNYVDLGAAGSCAQAWTSIGNCTAVGPTSHQITCANMPPGDYKFEVSGGFNSQVAGNDCNFKFSDGTDQFGYNTIYSGSGAGVNGSMLGRQTYTSSGTRTFKIQSSDNGASAVCGLNNHIAGMQAIWRIWRFPTQSQTVVGTDNLDSASQINYVPSVSGLGTGVITFAGIPDATYYTTTGVNATVCLRAQVTTPGSGAATFTMSLPSGVTVNSNTIAYGTSINGGSPPISVILVNGTLSFVQNGNFLTGSQMVAGFYGGCVTFPTTSKKPTNGTIYIAPPVKNIVRLTNTGSGTYTPTPGTKWIEVEMVGAGGGGGGSGTASIGTSGNGGNTIFGTSLLTAGGGFGSVGATSTVAGAGGTVIAKNSPAIVVKDGPGAPGVATGIVSGTTAYFAGGVGGSTVFGGGARSNAGPGDSAVANSGAGGAGGRADNVPTSYAGQGGGAGAYINAIIPTLSASYSYTVGAGGAGGTAGTSGYAGGSGGSGIIVITEHFTTFDPSTASAIIKGANGSVTTNGPAADTVEWFNAFCGTSASISSATSGAMTISNRASNKCTVTINPAALSNKSVRSCSGTLAGSAGNAWSANIGSVNNTTMEIYGLLNGTTALTSDYTFMGQCWFR